MGNLLKPPKSKVRLVLSSRNVMKSNVVNYNNYRKIRVPNRVTHSFASRQIRMSNFADQQRHRSSPDRIGS